MQSSSPSSITPEIAATQLLQRRRARASLEAYIDYSDLGFRPAFHHKLLLTHLEALERGDFDRLMVLMPPGSANRHSAEARRASGADYDAVARGRSRWPATRTRGRIVGHSHAADGSTTR